MEGGTIIIDAASPKLNRWKWFRIKSLVTIKGGDEELIDKFLIQSWNEGMVGLRTLTPFGTGEYLRASLYNGITQEDTASLANFMQRFAGENSV